MDDIKLPKEIEYVIDIFQNVGYKIYVVGGAVRDSLIGKNPNDWDLCTDASTEGIKDVLFHHNLLYIVNGNKHDTLTVVFISEEIRCCHINTIRSNLMYDSAIRDFTINSLYYNKSEGLIDLYCDGIDLRDGIIRENGSKGMRFKENPIRILRAIRLSCELGFTIEEETERYIHELKNLLNDVSVENINSEFSKLLLSPNPYYELKEYYDVFSVLFPEMTACYYGELYNHVINSVCNTRPDLVLRLTMLFHDIAKPFYKDCTNGEYNYANHSSIIVNRYLTKLRYPKKIIEKVKRMITYHNCDIPVSRDEVKSLLFKIGEDDFDLLMEVKRADILAQVRPSINEKDIDACLKIKEDIIKSGESFKLKDLEVAGDDLISIGMKEGVEVKCMLNSLLDDVMRGKVNNNHDDLLRRAKEVLDGDC